MKKASVVAVTISPVQASCGRERVASRGLTDRIDVMAGDYHALPHEDDTFDAALFLESAGYSDKLPIQFGQIIGTKPAA